MVVAAACEKGRARQAAAGWTGGCSELPLGYGGQCSCLLLACPCSG